ncbi:hypothetical protein LEP1GSC062_0050 [Leptospira alexanderi serovar Manhao 3 str. L 60]|uniref:Carbamoyltransferase domain-containing protein n=1 Tax=Leptospira alexanderi serovar Manhao 3 str. L 60 TaxID=1049759 RepID=V6HWH2_9LEPT|nr:hypothetical protein LEP1GSC062_0050 [Leptospira alexanderi serovar Manhao 3 str. L 60]
MQKKILGISAYYHDSAAALVVDGQILAAAQEERFTRKKHDSRFPVHAIEYCLKEAGLTFSELDDVVFYDKPLVKFERLLETYLTFAPKGIFSFFASMPVWIKEKLFLKSILKKEFQTLSGKGKPIPRLLFTEHHQAHAASAFFVSPFEKLPYSVWTEWENGRLVVFGSAKEIDSHRFGKSTFLIHWGCCIPRLLTTPVLKSTRENTK